MKRITVKDIARELGISVGTVSKALSGKIGVRAELRADILKKAKELSYSVNRVAQSLARKAITIGIVYPVVWSEFYGKIIDGMKEALGVLRDRNVTGCFITFSSLYSAEEISNIINSLIEEHADLVVLCPASVTKLGDCIERLNIANIPLILVGNDIESVNRLACVRVNAVTAGRIAAELMNYVTPAGSEMVVLLGDKEMIEHKEKVSAFEAGLEDGRRLRFTFETQDEPDVAAFITRKAVKDFPGLGGIYVATGNSLAVCEVLAEYDPAGRIKVIATDLFDEIIPYIKDRRILGVIFQDPIRQGREAIQLGYRILTERMPADNSLLISPSLILRSNLC